MTAGESARVEARRAREKAAYWTRRAEKYERGADGEVKTAVVLMGLEPEWQSLHDRIWPNRLRANIDHIAVGPGGIFLIDSKNWAGDVRVESDVLRVNGRSQDKLIDSSKQAAKAVAELIWPHARHVHSAVCFVGEREVSGSVHDVLVCSSATLPEMLRSRRQVLSAAEVTEVTLWLDAQLQDAGAPTLTDAPEDDETAALVPVQPRARSQVRRMAVALVGAALLMVLFLTLLPALSGALSAALPDAAEDDVPACAEPADERADGQRRQQAAADPRPGAKQAAASCR